MLGRHAPRRCLNHESLPGSRLECNLSSRGGDLQDTGARGWRGRAQGGSGRLRGRRSGKKFLRKVLYILSQVYIENFLIVRSRNKWQFLKNAFL